MEVVNFVRATDSPLNAAEIVVTDEYSGPKGLVDVTTKP
jgi:hypothetical protein